MQCIHNPLKLRKHLLHVKMVDLGCTAWTKSRTTPAALTYRFIDHRDPPSFIELDGGIGAKTDTRLTAGTNVWINVQSPSGSDPLSSGTAP